MKRIGLFEAVRLVFSKYATFSGRSTRSEYWWWAVFYAIVCIVLQLISIGSDSTGMVLGTLLGLVCLIPNLAVNVRRLHDVGKGGGWIFIILLPLIGWIWYLVLLLKSSEPFENRFGLDPHTEIN